MHSIIQIRDKYLKFMDGKYGFDTLNRDLFLLWFIIGFFNNFSKSRIVSLISLALPVGAAVRAFSTAVYKRSNENRRYVELKDSAGNTFRVGYRRIKDRKTHKYYKCSNCSTYFRVKRKPGEHYVDCPKCGKEFKVKIHPALF